MSDSCSIPEYLDVEIQEKDSEKADYEDRQHIEITNVDDVETSRDIEGQKLNEGSDVKDHALEVDNKSDNVNDANKEGRIHVNGEIEEGIIEDVNNASKDERNINTEEASPLLTVADKGETAITGTQDWINMSVSGSYDNYLIDKLLHSKAEMSDDLTDTEGFEKPPVSVQDDVILEDEEEEEVEEGTVTAPEPSTTSGIVEEREVKVETEKSELQRPNGTVINSIEVEEMKSDSAKPVTQDGPVPSPPKTPPGSPVVLTVAPCQITVTGTDGATLPAPHIDGEDPIGLEGVTDAGEGAGEHQQMEGTDEEFLRQLEEELEVLKDDDEDEEEEDQEEEEEEEEEEEVVLHSSFQSLSFIYKIFVRPVTSEHRMGDTPTPTESSTDSVKISDLYMIHY